MNDSIRQLESRREELRNRLIAIQKDLGRGLEKDYEEQAVQLENMEVLQEIARVAEEDLREVELQLSSLRSAESGS